MADNSNALWASRTGTRQYLGQNSKGATVKIGMGEGEFTPGELLKLALATCQTLSADHTLASKLGENFDATVAVESVKHDSEERYASMHIEIATDLNALSQSETENLIKRAYAAIEKNCTVGHTLSNGMPYTSEIVNE